MKAAALFLDDTLEVDAYIGEDKQMIFGILGSDRTLCQPQNLICVSLCVCVCVNRL